MMSMSGARTYLSPGCRLLKLYLPGAVTNSNNRSFSTSHIHYGQTHYKLVIVGGGSGGSAIASKFARTLKKGDVAVVEPSETHYYQSMFTLVGGGLKTFQETHNPTSSVLPEGCDWIKQSVTEFDPENNCIKMDNRDMLKYEFLLVALGIQLNYQKIKGAIEALEADDRVCSNYHPTYVQKTLKAANNFTGGDAIFSFPVGPIKCAGAPQKIAYILEDIFTRRGIRDKTNVTYNTALPVIFGIPKYAEALTKVVSQRNIHVNFRHNLIEVRPKTSEAVFEMLDKPGEFTTFKYDLLHIAPPCTPPEALRNSPLADNTGFLEVDQGSMQHVNYPNVFGIGDCLNVPTAKTAAAVAGQSGIVGRNIKYEMDGKGKALDKSYNGYTSCPLVVNNKQCILAEFGYDGKVLETFPLINQAKPRRLSFLMKAFLMPQLYWKALVRGYWHGPGVIRKIMRFGRQ